MLFRHFKRQGTIVVHGPRLAPAKGICTHYEDDPGLLAEIERLRESGERVVVRLPGVSVSAADVGCDRELVRRDGAWIVNKV